jgi:hypothetical protein
LPDPPGNEGSWCYQGRRAVRARIRRGRRELDRAETRLSEIQALVNNHGDAATIDKTLDLFSQ